MDIDAAGALRLQANPTAPWSQTEMAPLAEAFTHFIQSSSRLEEVYCKLQMQIRVLTQELAERNAELRESLVLNESMHAALQQIVNAMPCGVLVVRGDSSIALINAECCGLLGLTLRGEMDWPTLMECVGEECARLLESALALDGEHELRIEMSGAVRWIGVRSCRVCCGEERAGGYDRMLVLRDVTARRQAEEERERGRNAMALSEVAMMLAHEVRNPLASIELLSDLIEQDDERRGQWIISLRAGVRLLSGTVNNVLSFQGPRCADFVPVDVEEIVSSAISLLTPVAGQAGVRLVGQASNEEARVLGSAAGLQQVMVNLVMNGIRFTPAGGRVVMAVSQCESEAGEKSAGALIVVECVDSGPGIAEKDRERLFEAGYSGAGASPGLGLAVCKKIVAEHGGCVSAANVAEGGARFVVKLPAHRGECER